MKQSNQGNLDKPEKANSAQPTADTLREIQQVYEFKPGSYYVMEYDYRLVTPMTINKLNMYFHNIGINVVLVPTVTGQVLRPIPAIERTEHNSEYQEATTDTASMPQSNPDTLELKNFAEKFDLSLTQTRDILAWAESYCKEKHGE